MTDRELLKQALEALELLSKLPKAKRDYADRAIVALKQRLAQPEPVIDKSAARRIATALGWVPRGDTSTKRVDETAKQRQEQEPVAKWDASAPLIVHPHPAFQATLPRREWVGLTAAEFRKAVDGLEDLEDCWVALEHALKEKNNG